jgi:biopolymer transport protein ExbB/TolQ
MFNLTSKLQTIIIYGLISFLIAVVGSHIWTSLELSAANSQIETYKSMETTLKADVGRAVSAEKSCSEYVIELENARRKKDSVIKKYQNRLNRGGKHEKVDNLNDYIIYAERLYK